MTTSTSDNFEKTDISNNVIIVSPIFNIGDVVKHRLYQFRGVIVDIDPEFANSEEWYQSIPEDSRPKKDQPFYHLLAENSETFYSAYVSQQNLLPDSESGPIHHPDIDNLFSDVSNGRYILKSSSLN
jgi:heat shock protein HspQ